MNLDALLAAISPDGGPDNPAPPPSLSAPPEPAAPPPDAGGGGDVGPQLPPPGAVAGSMNALPAGPGIGDRLQEMLPMLIAGLMGGAALKNPGPYGRGEDVAGLAQGLLHGFHTTKQGQMAQAQQDLAGRKVAIEENRANQDMLDRAAGRQQKGAELAQKHQELSSNFMLNAVKGAEQFKDDPAAWASYAQMMDGVGSKVFDMEPGSIAAQLQFPDAARGKKARKEAADRVDELTKLYGPAKMFAPEVLDATTTFDGKPVKVRDLMALAEMAIVKPGDAKVTTDVGPQLPGAGTPIQAPSELVTPEPKEEGTDRQVLRAYAKKVGKQVSDLTPAEIKAAREEAGIGADPEMRALTKELARQRLADAQNKSKGVGEILEGTPEYRMAENIAFGRTTLAQAKGLYSGREAKGKETLRAVLDKAEQINPNFNAALFEQGYKFASNAKTQTAMAAIASVEPNIDKLIALSDKWDRTKYPSVNAFLKAAKFQIGNTTVSDFGQLQTIVGDELGNALGSGAASDLKVKLGLEMAGGTKGPEAFRSSMLMVKDALLNRKRGLLGQMGPYGAAPGGSDAPADAPKPPAPSTTPKVNPFRKPA